MHALVCKNIDTTQRRALRYFTEGAELPFVITANSQHAAYGHNRDTIWYSPKDAGIYMSIMLPLPSTPLTNEEWFITERIGHAIKWVLRTETHLRIEQRGINDLYLNNRKVGGIVCDIYRGYLIIGIGINVFRPKRVPAPLNKTAIWLNEVLRDEVINMDNLRRAITSEIERLVK